MTLDPDAATFTVSADRRFSANSNEMRVRVDASKNRLTIVAPRSVGTFLIARSLISLNGSAVSRINLNLLAAQRLEPQQILAERQRHVDGSRSAMIAALRPSSSSTSTSTRCDGSSVIFLPTMSG